MAGTYDLAAKRMVSSANPNFYRSESLHPDRILTEHDLVYLVEGSWEIWQDDACFVLGPDDVVLLHAGRHHYGRRPCAAGTRTLYIHINCAPQDGWTDDLAAETDRPASCAVIPPLVHSQGNPAVKMLFDKIIAAQWSDLPLKNAKLSLMTNLLLCELQECRTATHSDHRDMTAEIARLVRNSPPNVYSTRDLADRFFLSERTLVNRFKQDYGCSVYHYQLNIRLEMARQFLVDHPQAKIRETALNFGFYDEFHLSRLFKKKYGQSPQAYRQRLADLRAH